MRPFIFVHAVTDIVNRPVELTFIDGIAGTLCVTDVMDDVAAHVDAAILDGNIFRRIGIGDRQAVVVDRRIARRDRARINRVAFDDRLIVASTDGNLIVYFDAVQILNVFGQLDVEAAAIAVVYHADVFVGEVIDISTTIKFHSFGILTGYLIISTAVTFKDAAGRFNGRIDVTDLIRDIFQLTFRSGTIFHDTFISRIPGRIVEAGNEVAALRIRRVVRLRAFDVRLVTHNDTAISRITNSDLTFRAINDNLIGTITSGYFSVVTVDVDLVCCRVTTEGYVVVQGNLVIFANSDILTYSLPLLASMSLLIFS